MARPIFNKDNSFRGDLDVDLNEKGRKEADKLVSFFRRKSFSKIYGSDRKRVMQTLAPLAKSKGMTIQKVNNLESLNTGDFTGLPKSRENLKRLKWFNRHPETIIPGGESVESFRNRVDPVLQMIIQHGEESPHPTVAGVHGSVLKELYRLLYGKIESKARVETGGIVGVMRGSHGYEAIPVLGAKDKEDEGSLDENGS
jgi:broad specificity phosphatase PhoE